MSLTVDEDEQPNYYPVAYNYTIADNPPKGPVVISHTPWRNSTVYKSRINLAT